MASTKRGPSLRRTPPSSKTAITACLRLSPSATSIMSMVKRDSNMMTVMKIVRSIYIRVRCLMPPPLPANWKNTKYSIHPLKRFRICTLKQPIPISNSTQKSFSGMSWRSLGKTVSPTSAWKTSNRTNLREKTCMVTSKYKLNSAKSSLIKR